MADYKNHISLICDNCSDPWNNIEMEQDLDLRNLGYDNYAQKTYSRYECPKCHKKITMVQDWKVYEELTTVKEV